MKDDNEFSQYYEQGLLLGTGTTGTVKKCFKVEKNSEPYAVKIIDYKDDMEMLKMVIKLSRN